jgi:hypothetical protein
VAGGRRLLQSRAAPWPPGRRSRRGAWQHLDHALLGVPQRTAESLLVPCALVERTPRRAQLRAQFRHFREPRLRERRRRGLPIISRLRRGAGARRRGGAAAAAPPSAPPAAPLLPVPPVVAVLTIFELLRRSPLRLLLHLPPGHRLRLRGVQALRHRRAGQWVQAGPAGDGGRSVHVGPCVRLNAPLFITPLHS